MDATPDNPPTNQLQDGISEADVLAAASASGYPLQTLVAQDLRRDFYHVQEEWSYVDRDSKNLRTLDVFAIKYFTELWKGRPEKDRLDAGIVLLIECKDATPRTQNSLSCDSTLWWAMVPARCASSGCEVE